MREIRIFQSGVYECGEEVVLSAAAAHHVCVVLRMQVGAGLTLFNGTNREFISSIVSCHKKQVSVLIEQEKECSRESPLAIHLGQAISKGERMEWVMQKSVELGVASITPLISTYSVVKLDEGRMEKKWRQWQAIVIAACEQCGRNTVPEVYPPTILAEFCTNSASPIKFILHPEGNKTWRDYNLNSGKMTLLVGPEGGLSEEEVTLALNHGFHPLSLGPRILRTETAAISALSVLQAVSGDL